MWAQRAGANPSDGICQHWTMGNTIANYSTADGCDSDRTRIDFVWIRYEDGNGNRLDLSLSGIQAKIQAAGADRGYYQTTDRRYSDHRGLHTRVIW